MKDKIMNFLLLAVVLLALMITLARETPEETQPILALTSHPTLEPTPTPHPVDAYRMRREETREQEAGLLRALIASEQTAAETRDLAEAQLLDMTRFFEIELAVEAGLAAHGYGQALCVARQGTVTVIMAETLTDQQAAFIFNLIQEISGVERENIRIAAC